MKSTDRLHTVPEILDAIRRGDAPLKRVANLWRTYHGFSHEDLRRLLGGRHAAPALSRPGTCPGVEADLRRLIDYPEPEPGEDSAKKLAPGA
jgi:hypothetical protein